MLTSFKYFQLKNWSDLQKKQWIDTHSGAYASYVSYTILSFQAKIISNVSQFWCRCYPSRDDTRGVCLLFLHKYRYGYSTNQVASILTHLVGAALWAADIESQNNPMVKETAPKLRQAAAESFE